MATALLHVSSSKDPEWGKSFHLGHDNFTEEGKKNKGRSLWWLFKLLLRQGTCHFLSYSVRMCKSHGRKVCSIHSKTLHATGRSRGLLSIALQVGEWIMGYRNIGNHIKRDCGNTARHFLVKLNIWLFIDPAMPFPGIDPREPLVCRHYMYGEVCRNVYRSTFSMVQSPQDLWRRQCLQTGRGT